MCTCGLEDLQFSSQFQLKVTTDKPVVAIVGYFDIYFEKNLNKKVRNFWHPRAKLLGTMYG